MRRRRFLQTIAPQILFFTGCTSPTANESTMTRTDEDYHQRNLEITGSVSDGVGEWSVGIENQFKRTEPARIEITFENTLDESEEFTFGPTPPFSSLWGKHDEGSQLVLVPIDSTHVSVRDRNGDGEYTLVPDEPVDGCWQSVDELILEDSQVRMTIGPGEIVKRKYSVVGAHDNDECLPVGRYSFESEELKRNEEHFSFGFTIDLMRK